MNIIELLKQPEGKTLEFKRDLSSPTNILRTITAFANTAGGTLIIGVEDTSRFVVGIEQPHELEEKVVNLISDTLVPNLFPEVDTVPWRDTYLLVIRVFPSATRPHYYKKFGPEEGVFIRVGSTNRKADSEMIRELSRIVRNETFDEQPLSKLNSEDIDFRAASEQFYGIKQLTIKDLETLEILIDHQGKKVPTVAGLILFGKERAKLFPDAWIQAGRFKGTDKSLILDSAEFHNYPINSVTKISLNY